MQYILECLEKFQLLDLEIREAFGGETTYLKAKKLEQEFNVELSFVLILLAIDELESADLPEYLAKKFNLAPEKASLLTAKIEEEIIDPALESISPDLDEDEEAPFGFNKNSIHEIFASSLIDLLKGSPAEIKAFNILVFSSLVEDDTLEDKIIKALFANQEEISANKIILEDKEIKASVANFLKDFIRNHGSGMPDNLVLANYLNTSSNAKKLSASEKELLNRILKTYRNLVFFPESLDNVPMELWEIVPEKSSQQEVLDVLSDEDSRTTNQDKNKAVRALASKKNIKMKDGNQVVTDQIALSEKKRLTPDPLVEVSDHRFQGKANRKPISSVSTPDELAKIQKIISQDDYTLDELVNRLPQYSENSLEYRAIKQEIDRLRRQANKQSKKT